MTISAVIPCYNSAATIRDALRSVEAQTVKADEVVVVDDGSTDDSAGIVEREFPQCRLIRQANAGPAAARNRGVSEAMGDWIAFLDSDDAWLPWRLSAVLDLASVHPDVGLWCGEALRWSGSSTAAPQPVKPTFHRVALDCFLSNNPIATSSVLVRRDVLLESGGFDPAFRGPEDFDLWLRVGARAQIAFIEAPVALYRRVPGSLSMDDRRFLPEVLRVLDKAFASGGALASHPQWRSLALSTQYWNASWMAFERGDRRAAVALWARAWRLNRRAHAPARRAWFRLGVRYLVGERVEQKIAKETKRRVAASGGDGRVNDGMDD
jgi:glycosyltransferase involved in cell wall biosynthesis